MAEDIIANVLNDMLNCKSIGKKQTVAMPVSKLLLGVLEIMKKHGYIKKFTVDAEKFNKVIIEMGRINECKAIKPRFYVKKNELERYIRRYLPSRDFGIIILSTNKGLMIHTEALEKGIGGSLLAYCY